MNPASIRLIAVLLSSCACLPVTAAVVHKWVDANGVTHYSDAPPGIESAGATKIELPDTAGNANAGASGYYSIANQWQRLQRERLARDQLALEQARQKATAQTPEVVYVEKPRATSRRMIYLGPPYPVKYYSRSRYGSGRHYRHGNMKPGHGIRRSDMQVDRTSLGYYRHVQ